MTRINCWEFKSCGRQPGGPKVAELGVCAAATSVKANGVNGGQNAGRACWAVAGTLCGGKVQGSFAAKVENCLKCDFYQLVGMEEGPELMGPREIIELLK